jgi:hypothetical protein
MPELARGMAMPLAAAVPVTVIILWKAGRPSKVLATTALEVTLPDPETGNPLANPLTVKLFDEAVVKAFLLIACKLNIAVDTVGPLLSSPPPQAETTTKALNVKINFNLLNIIGTLKFSLTILPVHIRSKKIRRQSEIS